MQKESQVVEIRPDDIVLEEEIGRGSFAKVYRGKCRGQTVAVKVLHTQTFTDQVLEAFREEIAVMSQIHHPNLVLFMGACTIPGKLMIVTELMPRNLESVFLGKAGKHKRVALVQKLKMAKDAALGMNWLHKSTPMFIHRDFKLSNLLVDENYNVKVCDFGLTKMKQANDSLHDRKGSPLYMAPEVFSGSYSEKCDVYSFGLSFWEIINERRVFPRYENNLDALIKSRCENYETPPTTDDMLPRLVTLLERCWDKNPRQRPSFDVVVKELEEIIIEQCITDERGREVWKKASKGEDKMTWDEFARAVCISVGKVALPESYRSDRQMQCLKVLLCRQSEPNTVHAEKFGKVLAWFGPFSEGRDPHNRGRTFLDRIEETLSMKWFHGELSTQDAEERLDNRRPGTFLVRFSSSEKGAFTVSGVDRDRKKSHQRVVYHPNKGLYVMPDDTVYTSLVDAINDLCRSSKLRHPCPGSRYAKYFSEEPQPTSKNIALVKEEIKQLQLIHLNEICEVTDKDTSLDTTIDTASGSQYWAPIGGHHPSHPSHFHPGNTRNPFHTGNLSIHSSSGIWGNSSLHGGRGRGGGDSDSEDSLRIAPYIPPIPPAHNSGGSGRGKPSPYHAGGPGGHHSSGPSQSSASIQAALAANKAASSAATAMAYRQSPYTHVSTHTSTHTSAHASKYPSLNYSPHPLNSAEIYHSAPMTGMKSTASSSFSFSQFASTKHPFRSKDVLTAPLKSEEKKRGIFSRLKRGVTGNKDRDRDRDDGSDMSDGGMTSTWSATKSGSKFNSGKLINNNNSGGKKSGKKKKNSLNKKGHGRDHHHHKDDKDFAFHSEDHSYHHRGSGGGGDNGGGTSDDDTPVYATPYVATAAPTDSTSASTNSIPAHVLCTLQKAEDERMRKRLHGNYESDSSTEDLFPPYQPSSATSASSSYIKRAAEEKSRHLHHLVGGKEMQEQEEQDDHNDDDEEEPEEEEEEEEDGSDGESDSDDSDDESESESDSEDDEEEEEEKAKKKKSKAKESSRTRKEDKKRRRHEKAVAAEKKQLKAERAERRKERAAKESAATTTTTAAASSREKHRTKQPYIPVAVITRPAPAASSAPISLAATAPAGLMEAALLNAPRARRERKQPSEHRSSSSSRKADSNGNGNGSSSSKSEEPEGVRLDQLVAKTSTSPSSSTTLMMDSLGVAKHKKEKKERGSRGEGGSSSDEAEAVTATSSSSSSSTKEKKSKKEKSSGNSKGVKAEALQRRPPRTAVSQQQQQRSSTTASSDMTGGEEDEPSEKELNDPQGKKKKNKDEERAVITVF